MSQHSRLIAHMERKLRMLLACEEALNKAYKFPNRINRYDL